MSVIRTTVRTAVRPTAQLGALAMAIAVLAAGLLSSRAAGSEASGWVYLRGGALPAAGEPVVEVLAVGDVMTGRALADTPNLFAGVSDTLRKADLTIGNLEGAITARRVADDSLWLLLPLSTPASLAEAGFDLLGLANNHALDNGRAGLAETRRRLRDEGLEPVEGEGAIVREIDGLRIAVLAWNELGTPDQEPLFSAVRQARADADVVIVLVHWGREYQRHASLPQRDLARDLIDAGADVIVGAHPHVVQELRVVQPAADSDRARLVAYSLGNFAFDQGWGDTGQGLGLRLLFDAGGLRAAQALPLSTAPRPRWMSPNAASDLLARIVPPERLGFDCVEDTCEAVAIPEDSRSGIFASGAIDLTGDGVAEIIRRQKGEVEILQGGRSVWSSPPEWQVRDAALGDPNQDGRYEALLAVDKVEGTSQPFVVGYRGGRYDDLWGGSPVASPIREVELGDINGDGLEELAAIEADPDGSAEYLTVWRWHGWGFSLVWRSPAGAYRDLVLLPAESDRPARLSVATR
jgi:poly-gamma-glutamate synthesis protein (capsule biosynthesis protein)